MKRKAVSTSVVVALAASALAACSGGASKEAAGGSSKTGDSAEMPKIYIYQNTGALNQKPEGAFPRSLRK
ncbi:hypothetical protein LJK87_19860 [Paenibacillus sp. P25]|nr:hypothetical protein LJK87_19860 [Paenibacillus sp. P25]